MKEEFLKKCKGNGSVVSVQCCFVRADGGYETMWRGGGLLVEGGYVATTSAAAAAQIYGEGIEYFAEIAPEPETESVENEEEDENGADNEFEDDEQYDMARMSFLDSDDQRGISIFTLMTREDNDREARVRRYRGFSMNDHIFENDSLRLGIEAIN